MRHYKVKIDDSQTDSPSAKQISSVHENVEITTEKPTDPNYRSGKNTLYLEPKKGDSFDKCATFGKEYVCCNVHVLKSVKNCPYDCSYCFLQNYLNDGTLSSVADIGSMIDEVNEKTAQQPWRFFRIGTWELGDSLALENLTHQAKQLIESFTKLPNAILELRTKSDNVDPILDCDHQQKTVVAWSMNPKTIIDTQEHRTATLDQRLAAIKKVVDKGYLTAFHFDPMIYYEGWEDGYTDVLEKLFAIVPAKQITWISIGSLRFNPEMKQKMQANFPKTSLKQPEMVLGPDKKMRYIKPIRKKMYTHFMTELKRHLDIDDLSPTTAILPEKPLIYFCMERWDVWDECLGDHPRSVGHLDYLFTKSLEERYPGLVHQSPELTQYEKEQYSNL